MMPTLLLVAPIRAGKGEAWRRFTQTLAEAGHDDHAASRRRAGIDSEALWLVETAYGQLGVVSLTAPDPQATVRTLARSGEPFDCWFQQQLLDLCGLSLAQPALAFPADMLFDWQSQPALDLADDLTETPERKTEC